MIDEEALLCDSRLINQTHLVVFAEFNGNAGISCPSVAPGCGLVRQNVGALRIIRALSSVLSARVIRAV